MSSVFSPGGISNFAHVVMTDFNLATQFALIAILFAAIHFEKKGKVKQHGNMVFIAVLIQISLIVVHMEPSLQGDVGRDIISNIAGAVPLLSYAHTGFGVVTIILASWLAGAWAAGWTIPPYCYGKKSMMILIYRLWIVTLSIGIILYVFHWYVYPG